MTEDVKQSALDKHFHPDTIAVRGGQVAHGAFGYPVPNLVLNSAVLLDSVQQGWDMLTNETVDNIAYQRYSNPTIRILEEKFAAMEEARYSLAVNSGMTACYLLFRAILKRGDHVVAQHSLYHEISDQLLYDEEGCGVEATFVTDYSLSGIEDSLRPNTRMLFVETPTNPAMYDLDIRQVASLCKERNVIFIVDNTLLTHEYQKPLALGADITIYSTTKAINGHGDALGAVISTNNHELRDKLKAFRDNTGLILDPFSAWLTIRGLRTLRLRLERQSENAHEVVQFLRREFPQFRVLYPPELKHSQANEITGGGGILSLVLDSKKLGTAFINNLSLMRIGTTFGNLESLCYHFGTFTRPHRDIEKIGIPLGLVRLSMGIEHSTDIIADIRSALNKAIAASGT